MSKILIVEKSSLKILHRYESQSPTPERWGGLYGDMMVVQHIACPHVLDSDCVKVVRDQMDNMMVVADLDLAEKKKQAAWIMLRHERNMLLAQSDWTQVLDAPLNQQDRESWKEYRQQLRDMPETVLDPESVVWPEKPHRQI
jgi:hypothetical protein